jgi:hypothetical protein
VRLANDTLIAEEIDFSSPWVSDAIWCGHVGTLSISLIFEGAPEGTLRLECSNDKAEAINGNPTGVNVSNWAIIDGSSQLIDEAGDHTWAVTNVSWRWTRIRWVPSAGTATLTEARFNTKGF